MRSVPLCLRLVAVVAVPIVLLYSLSVRGWYATEPAGQPVLGVNFSCKRAEYLGQDCTALFRSVVEELGVRHVRLSAYWSDIERRPGVYEFDSLDRLLDIAAEHGVVVTVTVGMRAQRYPEFWFPTWLRQRADLDGSTYPEDHPELREALLAYLDVAARHIGAHPAVDALQVENEAFVPSYAYGTRWRIRPEFLAMEIAVVRAADPGRHPVMVSHASWLRKDDSWRWILEHADIIGQSVYTKRQRGPWDWLYIFPYRLGPLTPDLPGQARAARREGKQLWIAELQAEPFEAPDIDLRAIPTAQAASFSRRWLEENVRLARRSGAVRAYLWGVEWWAYLRDARGEPELWESARPLFSGDGARVSPSGQRR